MPCAAAGEPVNPAWENVMSTSDTPIPDTAVELVYVPTLGNTADIVPLNPTDGVVRIAAWSGAAMVIVPDPFAAMNVPEATVA